MVDEVCKIQVGLLGKELSLMVFRYLCCLFELLLSRCINALLTLHSYFRVSIDR